MRSEGKGSTFFVRLPAEGSPQALKAGTKLIVGIKAAETGEKSTDTSAKSEEKPGEVPSTGQANPKRARRNSNASPPKAGEKAGEVPGKPEDAGEKT